jgi:hypothetical protein
MDEKIFIETKKDKIKSINDKELTAANDYAPFMTSSQPSAPSFSSSL